VQVVDVELLGWGAVQQVVLEFHSAGVLPVGCGGRISCAGGSAVHGLLLLCFRHCGGSPAGLLSNVQGSACRLLELPLTHDGDALLFGCCCPLRTRTGQLGCWWSTTSSRGGATR